MVQSTDYGVWSDVMREQKSDESVYRFGYQGQFAEKDEETGWSHFELREYDAVIGRWTAVDPKRQFYSPYVGLGNSPINGTDPDGGGVKDWIYKDGKYSWDPNAFSQATTPLGYAYVGPSLSDVFNHFEMITDYGWIDKLWIEPDIDFSGWPGEIVGKDFTLMEKWEMSDSWLGDFTYSTADATYVTAQFFMPWKEGGHLN